MAAPRKDKDRKSDEIPTIALNKRARYEYFIEENLEAGLVLQGWEVKSLRAGKAQITEGYVIVKDGEAWLIGAHISPLQHDVDARRRRPDAHAQAAAATAASSTAWSARSSARATRIVPLELYWKQGQREARNRRSPRASRRTTSATPRRTATGSARSRALHEEPRRSS